MVGITVVWSHWPPRTRSEKMEEAVVNSPHRRCSQKIASSFPFPQPSTTTCLEIARPPPPPQQHPSIPTRPRLVTIIRPPHVHATCQSHVARPSDRVPAPQAPSPDHPTPPPPCHQHETQTYPTPERRVPCLSGVDCPAGRLDDIPSRLSGRGAGGGGRKGQVRFPAVVAPKSASESVRSSRCRPCEGGRGRRHRPACHGRSRRGAQAGMSCRGAVTQRGRARADTIRLLLLLVLCSLPGRGGGQGPGRRSPDGRRNEDGNCTEPDRVRGTNVL